MTRRQRSIAVALFSAFVVVAPALAVPVDITAHFTNGTATQQAVFTHAVADWEAVLFAPVGLNVLLTVNVTFATLGIGNGGSTFTVAVDANGLPSSGNIKISTSTDMFYYTNFGDAIPVTKKDALSVARHELGHALGFNHNPDGYAKWDACVDSVAHTFGCRGVLATLGTGGSLANALSHLDVTAHPGDLMDFTVGLGNRREISTLDLRMLCASFLYQCAGVVPEPADFGALAVGAAGVAGISWHVRRRRTA